MSTPPRFQRRPAAFHGERLWIAPEWSARLADAGIGPGTDWATVEGDQLVSQSPATRCFRTTLADGEVVYFKRYVYPRKFWLEFWMRAGKAAVEAWAYDRLQGLGVPSLEVIAFGERRIFGMLIATFVVTRGIADTIDLSEFALEHWYPLPRVERRAIARELSDGLAKQLRTAHAGGFFHHDIKWRNVLVRQREGHWETIWIDAPRASRMRFREHRGVVVDLSCLGRMAVQLLCPYECMRFVCRYLGRERTPGAAKNLFREVQAHLDRRPPKPLVLPPRPDD